MLGIKKKLYGDDYYQCIASARRNKFSNQISIILGKKMVS